MSVVAEEVVFFDPADPQMSIEEAIDWLVSEGESRRSAEQIVKVARGIWKPLQATRTKIIDGEEVVFIIN